MSDPSDHWDPRLMKKLIKDIHAAIKEAHATGDVVDDERLCSLMNAFIVASLVPTKTGRESLERMTKEKS